MEEYKPVLDVKITKVEILKIEPKINDLAKDDYTAEILN